MPSKQKDVKFSKAARNAVAPPSKRNLTSVSKLQTTAGKSSTFKGAPTSSTTAPAAVAPASKSHRTVDSYYDECQCKLYLVAIIALVNAFTCGQASSLNLVLDPDQILDFYRYQPQQYSLAMALYFIMGNIAGASVAKHFIQQCGPKRVLLIASFSFTIGWLLLLQQIFILNSLLFIRFINGASVGLASISLLVYLEEISLPSNRGFLLTSFTTATIFGTAFPALYCLQDPYLYTVLVLGFNLLASVTLYLLPESPLFILKSYSNDPLDLYKAEKALRLVRSTTSSDSCATLFEISRLVAEKEHFAELLSLSHPLFYRPLRLLICLVLLMQGTFGSLGRLFGRPMISILDYLGESRVDNNTDNSNLTTALKVDRSSASAYAVVQLATAISVSFLLVRLLERRTVLVCCGGVMAILQLVLGVLVILMAKKGKKESAEWWASSVQYLSAAVSTTIESVGWLVITELPVHEHRTYSVAVGWVASWLLTGVTVTVVSTYAASSGGALFFFVSSFTTAATTVAIYIWLPKKLKGRSCSQIAAQFIGVSHSVSQVAME